MKAARQHDYGDVSKLIYEDAPTPTPKAGEVLIKVAATSINPVDWKMRSGAAKERFPLHFPDILGRDVAGTVTAVGDGVSTPKVGDRVLGLVWHSYAEQLVANAADLALIPKGLEDTAAAALPLVVTTGAQLIERAGKVGKGQRVFVTGALGGVGRTAVFVAKQHGATVFVGVRKKQLEEAKALGSDGVFALDDAGSLAALDQVDVIADTVGGEVADKILPKLRTGGTYASVVGPPAAAKGKDIHVEAFMATPDAVRLGQLAGAVVRGELKIPVAKVFRLSEIRQAQQLAEKGGAKGKVVVVP